MTKLITSFSALAILLLPVPTATATSQINSALPAAQSRPLASLSTIQEALTARDIISEFHDVLISAMKQAEQTKLKGRYTFLSPAVDGSFHLGLTAKQSAGRRAWKAATENEQKDLVAAFRHWTISNYAHQFNGYSGETFVIKNEKPGPRKGMVLVETLFSIVNSDPVTFTYLMIKHKGRWGVYDVIVKRGTTSISQLAKYISEFKSIAKDGLPALTSTLNKKAEELLSEQ